jgi:hypothetical protein
MRILALLVVLLTACDAYVPDCDGPDGSHDADVIIIDAGTEDAGSEDAGFEDGGTFEDAGVHDGGVHDGGTPDGGIHDGGTTDGGTHDGGCPEAPFDTEDPALAACTRTVTLAGGFGFRRLVLQGTAVLADVTDALNNGHDDENRVWSVAIGRGVLVAAGDKGVVYSTDGALWLPITGGPSGAFHTLQVAYDDDRFVLVGLGGQWTSLDGMHFTGMSSPWPSGVGHLKDLRFGDGRWLAIADSGKLRLSEDHGATWTDGQLAPGLGGVGYDLIYGLGRFVAVGHGGNAEGLHATSADGLTWPNLITNAMLADAGADAGALAFPAGLEFDGVHFFALPGGGSNTGLTSQDGLYWTPKTFGKRVSLAAHEGNTYAGVNANDVYYSHTPTAWDAGSYIGAVDNQRLLDAVTLGKIRIP